MDPFKTRNVCVGHLEMGVEGLTFMTKTQDQG